jgi:hypothetical protein
MPFVDSDFSEAFSLIISLFAIGLALKQSLWEEMKGTYHYLLHRPLPRQRVFAVKMCVGLAAVLAAGVVAVLIHALWAATPGNHPSPFFWSMTVPAWQLVAVAPVVYASAFLSGMRPARWYGSKLLPLIGGGAIAYFLAALPWWWLAFAGSAIATTALVACTLQIAATRDY